MEEFMIPVQPEDLLDEDVSTGLKVLREVVVVDRPSEAIAEAADRIVYDICEQDALCIVDQRIFDEIYGLVRGFMHIPSASRTRILDALCTNLSVLSASVAAMQISDGGESQGVSQADDLIATHRSALKAYVFFLYWTAHQCEAEEMAAPTATSIPVPTTAKRRQKNTDQALLSTWDWSSQRVRVAKALCSLSEVQLEPLFAPLPVEEPLLRLWTQFGLLLLDQSNAAVLRDKVVKEGTARTFSAIALRYGKLEEVAHALYDVLAKAKHELISVAVADIAEFSSRRNNDSRLAVELLGAVTMVTPEEYHNQMATIPSSVRAIAHFISDLAERLPRTVASNSAQLVQHLAGKAWPIRSAIVQTMGSLIAAGFEAPPEGHSAEAATNSRNDKQRMLEQLLERARDKTAYTRAAACRTWRTLVQPASDGLAKIPMSHWLPVTELAIGRLKDNSAIVRKSAMQLLGKLLECNPFSPELRVDRFEATLGAQKLCLQSMMPETLPEDSNDQHLQSPSQQDLSAFQDGIKRDPDGCGASWSDSTAALGCHGVQLEDSSDVGSRVASPRHPPRGGAGALEMQKVLVAALESAYAFASAVSQALPALKQLLASPSVTDVQEAIGLLVTCVKFDVNGSAAAARHMLCLTFHRDQGVKTTVVDAIVELHFNGSPSEQAANLVALAKGSTLGELGSLEAVIKQLMQKELVCEATIEALWGIAGPTPGSASPDGTHGSVDAHSALSLLALVAVTCPATVQNHLDTLLQVGFGAAASDGMMARQACLALQSLARLPPCDRTEAQTARVTRSLLAVVLSPRCHPADWYGASEAAIATIYALHPRPGNLCAAMVDALAERALGVTPIVDAEQRLSGTVSAARLSRLCFCIGHVALQHLVFVERNVRTLQRMRAEHESTAQTAAAAETDDRVNPQGEEAECDMGVGAGAASDDVTLETLKETADAEIVAGHTALGRYVPLVVSLCQNSTLMGMHPELRASALLALSKLMVIDGDLCDANLVRLFSLLGSGSAVEPSVRGNLVIAMGDLALRFPNCLQRWTDHLYRPLSDCNPGVRKTALMVLTHLILNDMLKVKGHIAKIAFCLEDDDAQIAQQAKLFFEELSQKTTKNVNPIYNLLPDILSSLREETSLTEASFQAIMATLLKYVNSKRNMEPLVDKLTQRLGNIEQASAAPNIAYCLTQLQLTDKALRRLCDTWKVYQAALDTPAVLACFKDILSKARKTEKARKADKKGDLKDCLDDFETKLMAKAAQVEEAEVAAAQSVAPEPVTEAGLATVDVKMEDVELSSDTAPAVSDSATGLSKQLASLSLAGQSEEDRSTPEPPAEGEELSPGAEEDRSPTSCLYDATNNNVLEPQIPQRMPIKIEDNLSSPGSSAQARCNHDSTGGHSKGRKLSILPPANDSTAKHSPQSKRRISKASKSSSANTDDLPEQRRDDKENIQQGNIPERPDDTIIHSKGFSSSQTRTAPAAHHSELDDWSD